MSIKATAVVKRETKVDPKKPNDEAYHASLSVLNEDGKEYGLPRYLGEFREVAVLLNREAGVTHEQLHERFAAYERGEEISLWDNKANAEAYNTKAYPEVLKALAKFIEGTPKVQTGEVVNSTFHKIAVGVGA